MVELDMTAIRDLEMQRRAEHKCIECGAALSKGDIRSRIIRCAACRETRAQAAERLDRGHKQRTEQVKTKRQQPEKATTGYAEKVKRCKSCYWANVHDDYVFCPSVQGTCLRREILC